MSEPFLGQITMFAGNFAPRGWAFCDGQLLPISQYQALFSLLGTIYGGDGRTTFALPDLRGRVPIHAGHGPGLTDRRQGSRSGTETVTLSEANMPAHSHDVTFIGDAEPGTSSTPGPGLVPAQASEDIYGPGSSPVNMAAFTSSSRGASQAHNNMQPFLVVHYIIALQGIFPSRS